MIQCNPHKHLLRSPLKHLAVAVAALAICVPSSALELDEVLAKHRDARGGVAAWQAVDTLVATGRFEGFSQAHPFTLVRTRDQRRMYFDHVLGDKRVVIGYDGETAWWDNPWIKEGAQRIQGADLAVVERDLDLPNPFFDYEQRGLQLTLVGDSEIEGTPAIQVDVTRADGLAESWYLDPQSFLEIARVSPGSDFGEAMPQTTFYDDFRDIEGLMIPFRTYTTWYTRYRAMEIADVEINVGVDETIFNVPNPPGMDQLQNLLGTFKVAVQQRQSPNAPWQESEHTATLVTRVAGTLIEESWSDATGEGVRTFSYDPHREVYRVTAITESGGYVDVQEGSFKNSRLTTSDAKTGTKPEVFGRELTLRTSIFKISPEGFSMELDGSFDGTIWMTGYKATYTRMPEP